MVQPTSNHQHSRYLQAISQHFRVAGGSLPERRGIGGVIHDACMHATFPLYHHLAGGN